MFGFLPPLFLFVSSLFPIVPSGIVPEEIDMPEIIHIVPSPKLSPPADITITPIPTPEYSKDNLMPRLDAGERDYEEPELPKIPSYNLKSDKEMPTDLPQNAVENSPALDPVLLPSPTPTLIDEEVIYEPLPPVWDPPPVIVDHSNQGRDPFEPLY